MTISFLFLLLLFIDGFSLAEPPVCDYNKKTALDFATYPCYPTGHCKEIQLKSGIGIHSTGLDVFACDSGYVPEMIDSTPESVIWLYNADRIFCGETHRGLLLIRCRKQRVCDLPEYFDATQCDDSLVCTQPTMGDANTVKCNKGDLEVYLYNRWTPAEHKISCNADRQIIAFDMGTNDVLNAATIQLLRCKKYAVCNKVSVESLTATSSGECVPITVNEYNITCPAGYNLEAQSTDFWVYIFSNYVSCLGLSITPSYAQYRCWKQRTCDMRSLFDASLCDPRLSCKNVILKAGSLAKYQCPDKYQLEYIPLGSSEMKWQSSRESSYSCDEFSRLTYFGSGEKHSRMIPERIRCFKEKKCDIDMVFDASKCDGGSAFECEKPKIESPSKSTMGLKTPLTCREDFGLQAQFTNQLWVDVTNSVCNHDQKKFEFVSKDGVKLTEYPIAFRCVRKKIPDTNSCGPGELCKKPFNCTSLDCLPLHALQVKIDDSWTVVKSARCDSHAFHVTLMDGTAKVENSIEMKCVRMQYTKCEVNPCPACSSATFHPSTKWNESAKFDCGSSGRPVHKKAANEPDDFPRGTILECDRVENIDTVYWKGNNEGNIQLIEAKSVDCEYFCTLHSPLNLTCPNNDTHCKAIIPDNSRSIYPCNVFYKPEQSKGAIPIDFLECNLQNGSWIASRKDEFKEVLPIGSNVYCFEGDCDETRFFPPCEDDEECKQHTTVGNKFHCAESTFFWSREAHANNWVRMRNVTELECTAGQIVANGVGQSYEFQATCRPESEAAHAKQQNRLGLIIGITFMILILIVIIITTVILRVAGHGWIHTIILDKIRGDKGQSFNVSASSIASKKAPYVYTPKQNSSRKTTKHTQRNVSKKTARTVTSVSSCDREKK